MRKTCIVLLLFAIAAGLAPAAFAQTDATMMGPPKVLEIIREEVKPGKAFAHMQHEAQWTRAMLNAKFDTPMLAVTSTTGPSEAWFLEGYDSVASLEKDADRLMKNANMRSVMQTNTAPEAEYVQDSRTMIAVFRPDLSYKPGGDIGTDRYFGIATIRVRLGQDAGEVFKIVNEARERGNYDFRTAVYQVVSGAPAGTFLSFHSMKSMAEMDQMPPQAYSDALKESNFAEVSGKVVTNFESRVYEFSPEMSNPTKEWVAANPSFWKPKPVMAKKAAAAGAETPAAKKEPEKK